MNRRIKLASLLFILFVSESSYAMPEYFIASGVLSFSGNGHTILNNKRNEFLAAATTHPTHPVPHPLALESFESFIPNGNPIDFGSFTATLISGGAGNIFTQVHSNFFITTHGNAVLSFGTTGTTAVEFAFDSKMNAFGVDITSIDSTSTTVTFLDEIGNVLNDFAYDGILNGGATFFGVYNTQPFSRVRFNFGGAESGINFDRLQFGASPNAAVPEPELMILLGLGFAGLTLTRRRIVFSCPR